MMSTILTVRSSGSECFLQKLSEKKGMQKLEEFVVANFYFKHSFFSVCSISLVASVMLSIYAKP